MPLYTFRCSCGATYDELMSYEQSLRGVTCSSCRGLMTRTIAVPGKAKINRANDLDHFGTARYAEDRAKKCGVPV
jgi:hypothetical protein